MEKIGLDYESVKLINNKIIYAVVTGYGTKGPWAGKPGQDLLVQSLSGLTFLSGDADDDPTPFGLAVADILCGAHLVQGILAALIKRSKTKQGALVEVSLLETMMDFQFEVVTTYLNDGGKLPQRAAKGNAHAYLSAPYGIYKTKDRYIALAMEDLNFLGETIGFDAILGYTQKDWFEKRDELMAVLQNFLRQHTTAHWLNILEKADIWCADVFNYEEFLNHNAYKVLQMDQIITTTSGESIKTTRCPIRIDEERIFNSRPAPLLGQHNSFINREFGL
jgi:crotonobetainyl-CoA:carnitine CoA-transferase CaiB-like acyl-CoA transferase